MKVLITVPFYKHSLTLINSDGKPFVAMYPIVEGMGLKWQPQQRELIDHFESTVTTIVTIGADGRKREMLCLPLDKLPAWLLTLNLHKVKPEIRHVIERYQAESEATLWQYWTTGIAQREEILQKLADRGAAEAESFKRGSIAGKGLYIRKLEKQRNQAEIAALQARLPFI